MATVNLGEIFRDSTKMIDNLIDILNNNKWTVYKGNSFHDYHWPDIILSERKQKMDGEDWDTEYLGAYFLTPLAIGDMKCQNVRNNEYATIKDEGYVVLYENTILECASSVKFGTLTPEQVIIGLSTIVLIHEFAHWIILDVTMEGVEKFKKTNFHDNYKKDSDFKNFHEGLAQYFTYFMIQNDKHLKNIFFHLNKGQSDPYKKWEELINPSTKRISNKDFVLMLKTILFYRELISNYKIKSQSFEHFKFIFLDLINKIAFNKKVYSFEEIIISIKNVKVLVSEIDKFDIEGKYTDIIRKIDPIYAEKYNKGKFPAKDFGL